MGGYLLWHTIVDVSANTLGALDEERSDLYRPMFYNNYQMRTPDYDRGWIAGNWPRSMFSWGDPTTSPLLGGQDMTEGGFGWEPWSVPNEGASRPSYVQGNITDANNAPLPLTTVLLFLTSSGVLVGSGLTDNNGNYSLPTPYAGQAHFVYANYGTNTYVGGTRNDLTPNG